MPHLEIIDCTGDKPVNITLGWKCRQWIDCEYLHNESKFKDEDDFTLHIVSNMPKDFYQLEIDKVSDMITNSWRKLHNRITD
jgi:hypothetical protein